MCQEDLHFHSAPSCDSALCMALQLGKLPWLNRLTSWESTTWLQKESPKLGLECGVSKNYVHVAKVQLKIKQKLYEKQSPRQGWHSLGCPRGCCTDSCHFSVWVVFLCHRMEPLLVVTEKSAVCGHEFPKDRAGTNRDLLEKALQSTYCTNCWWSQWFRKNFLRVVA